MPPPVRSPRFSSPRKPVACPPPTEPLFAGAFAQSRLAIEACGMRPQLEAADTVRRALAPRITQKRKTEFGQFMTPSGVACFMASLFPPSNVQTCRLLDAGAGVGALSCAFLDRWVTGGFGFAAVEATAYEIDDKLRAHLERHLTRYPGVTPRVIADDYIERATANERFTPDKDQALAGYTHAILNPPYKKINSQSAHRLALRRVGIETVNLYSAFVALAVAEAAPGGQIVAIIPRSFCNGPYYRAFRDFILERAAIRHMHLFESRSKAFRDDKVLQENIIIRLERGGQQRPVTVSTSTDDGFSDLISYEHPFDRIVFPDDPERFIHVPTTTGKSAIELSPAVRYSLADIGIQVSTGPVVDFRLKVYLRDMPEPGAAPLIYPGHLSATGAIWPVMGSKKPNAILRNDETEKWLYPNEFYCVVRRFSSKEEKRRIVASVIDPAVFGDHSVLGFENHLNLFHENRRGLPEALAHGLAVFLNTSAVDEYFRRFNGHTQVNATDLKRMKYPNRSTLIQLGKWAMRQGTLTQEQIDARLGTLNA
jgi:tRNA1(Val) A37 N6-methylase TrmN6